ncbi:MAG: PilT/PilU family type 4a pilus ATPase [Candidatus Omnitrophota bacterium]|jgi:pilus retraction protein PilT
MDIHAYLNQCVEKLLEANGQDLFLKVGAVPRTRIGGVVTPLAMEPMRDETTRLMAKTYLHERQLEGLEKNHSVDFAFSLPGSTRRFRGNLFMQQGHYSAVIRTLWKNIPTLEELGIPPVLKTAALERSGIILIGGTVASGKTTTLHAMIEAMNQSVPRHIVTIEDPVEYLHEDKQCIINQREVGEDTRDFTSAMKYIVRQSPDVVVIGEMRDAETFQMAIASAEVGRLVMATVHAKSVVQIFDRVLGFFPPAERDGVLSQLYPNITCFCVQKLLTARDGYSLVPAFEVMIGNYMIRQLVHERKFDKIPQALRNCAHEGMQTMDQALLQLCRQEKISMETALAASERPQELENIMRGIEIDGQTGKILGG